MIEGVIGQLGLHFEGELAITGFAKSDVAMGKAEMECRHHHLNITGFAPGRIDLARNNAPIAFDRPAVTIGPHIHPIAAIGRNRHMGEP